MKKAILIFLLACHAFAGQISESPSSMLVRTFSTGDYLNAASEAALILREVASKPGDRIAVRICSEKPMPVTLVIASGRPFLIESILKSYGYSSDRILFLRNEDCRQNGDKDVATTEFWAVPEGASPPKSNELVKASQVRAEEYPLNEKGHYSTKAFESNLRELANKLRRKPNASGIVVAYYLRRPSAKLKNNLRKAEEFLRRNGLSKDRYYTSVIPWTGTVDSDDKEPRFPSLMSVEIDR